MQLSVSALFDLHFVRKLPVYRIAEELGINRKTVTKYLKTAGYEPRFRGSTDTCIESGCNRPAAKKFNSSRRSKDGTKTLYGTRCLEHRRMHEIESVRAYRKGKDPLYGTRSKGKKPIPTECPNCREPFPSVMAAKRHHKAIHGFTPRHESFRRASLR